MKKYKCTFCGYIYEPEKGDKEAAIIEGTEFNDLPEDWTCPICRMGKEKFKEVEIVNENTMHSDQQSLEEQQIAPKNDTRYEGNINTYDYEGKNKNGECY